MVIKKKARIKAGFTYKGYEYTYWPDRDEGFLRYYHSAKPLDGGPEIDMDWSTLCFPTENEFKMWIDLGMPKRVGIGPLRHEDLIALKRSQA